LIFDLLIYAQNEYITGRFGMIATTIRIDGEILGRVDGLAEALSRSRSWVINQAIERFLDYEEWYVKEVKDGLTEVERGEIATDKEAAAKFRKWGADAG
jgi:predicted transcriptional regulator